MIRYTAVISQFEEKGDKSGWTYIQISADIAQQLKPGNKRSFRVRGMLDEYRFEGLSLLPMGGGNFIMALNAEIRKNIHKRKGAMVQVQIELDKTPYQAPVWLMECLSDEPGALSFFNTLQKSHQNYFIKWIESAKTEETKARRMAQAITVLSRRLGFGEMIRNRNPPP